MVGQAVEHVLVRHGLSENSLTDDALNTFRLAYSSAQKTRLSNHFYHLIHPCLVVIDQRPVFDLSHDATSDLVIAGC